MVQCFFKQRSSRLKLVHAVSRMGLRSSSVLQGACVAQFVLIFMNDLGRTVTDHEVPSKAYADDLRKTFSDCRAL